MNIHTSLRIAALALGIATIAEASPTQLVRNEEIKQYVLADSIGKTLYTFDNDPIDGTAPACNAKCAEIWPPVSLTDEEAAALVAPFGVVARATGLKQLTHEGRPLYTFHFDRNAGDILGDGIGGIWHIVGQDLNVAGCTEANMQVMPAGDVTVGIAGQQYTPRCLRIKKGTTVKIPASSFHPMKAMDEVLGFANPLAALGQQTALVTQKFEGKGVFGFFCTNHGGATGTGMSGIIEVVD